jgi:hypothetical protein
LKVVSKAIVFGIHPGPTIIVLTKGKISNYSAAYKKKVKAI